MSKLTDAARGYLDVRFRHRGRSRHGLDCAGLMVLAYRDCGVVLPDFRLYGREPHKDGLARYVRAAMGPEIHAPLADGDVLLMRFAIEPHHLAMVVAVEYGGVSAFNIIHADGHVGRVLEQRLTPDMAQRITHQFRRAV